MTPTPPTFRRALVAALASAALCLSLLAAQPALAQSTPDPAASASTPAPSESPIIETPDPTPEPSATDTASPSPEPTTPEVTATPTPGATESPAPTPTPSPSTTAGAAIAAAAAFSATLAEASAAVAGFQAGNIINDATFTNKNTMSASAIDTFFRKMVSTCQSGYTCLKDYRQNTPNRAADSYCSGYSGAANESAATIIAKVSQSCNINPQVLIVMLQKEQGLVTHTWPSQWRYDMALGQGCPDTAPCDPAFAGFFYQIYGAARQMNIYMEGRYFTYYPAGRTSNIYWHPNASCGTAPVYISNRATSALYYYTPYQPNRAALNAGYGEGDGCSSYGNRNFYLYFTQWFGSTQGGGGTTGPLDSLVRADGSATVYLISAGAKRPIANTNDLAVFTSRLGGTQIVSSSALAALPTGPAASRFVRDARTGSMMLLQPDGTSRWLSSAELVTRYGFRMDGYTPLDPAQVDRYSVGPAVGDFFRGDTDGTLYKWESNTKRGYTSAAAWVADPAAQGKATVSLPQTTVNRIRTGLPILTAGSLVKERSQAAVYLAGTDTTLIPVPAWGTVIAMGMEPTSTTVYADGALSGYSKSGSALSPIVTCSGVTYIASGVGLTRTSKVNFGSLPMKPSASICATITKVAGIVVAPVLIKELGGDAIYALESGVLRHIQNPDALRQYAGASAGIQIGWGVDAVRFLSTGPMVYADGTFLSFGDARVFYVQGGRLRTIPSVSAMLRLNGGTIPAVESLSAADLRWYRIGSDIPK
ncbi:hypothetical protein [Microbacterium sp. ZW T5_56]|uniref:hypothetical protein n=1 Tax=Microbacterium sp. ZW T5_56 TaxID=3378081 RepID=UPI0038551F37